MTPFQKDFPLEKRVHGERLTVATAVASFTRSSGQERCSTARTQPPPTATNDQRCSGQLLLMPTGQSAEQTCHLCGRKVRRPRFPTSRPSRGFTDTLAVTEQHVGSPGTPLRLHHATGLKVQRTRQAKARTHPRLSLETWHASSTPARPPVSADAGRSGHLTPTWSPSLHSPA